MKKELIFARNIAYWGEEQQEFLAGKSIFIAGVGALGCIVAEILVRSGIGRLYIADRGIIDPPDLNRQALYTTSDLDKAKVDVAARRLRAMTGHTEIIDLNVSIGETDITDAVAGCQGIADCLDNFPSRFALERCVREDMFMVSGALLGDYGQLTTVIPGRTVMLSELYAGLGRTPKTTPVTPSIVFCIGSLMAQEVLKNLLGEPELAGQLLIAGMSGLYFERVPLKPAASS